MVPITRQETVGGGVESDTELSLLSREMLALRDRVPGRGLLGQCLAQETPVPGLGSAKPRQSQRRCEEESPWV